LSDQTYILIYKCPHWIKRSRLTILHTKFITSELGILEWDILNPDRLINLEINNNEVEALFNLEIKKKMRLSINPDINHSKVPISDHIGPKLALTQT